jgi:hypothetical protein
MQPRRSVLSFAFLLATACGSSITGPDRQGPDALAPSLQTSGAATSECTDLIYGATLQDVVVPAGASCILAYSTVSGNLTVMKGGSIYSVANQIAGKAEFDNPASVELVDDVIAGTLSIDGDRRDDGNAPYYVLSHVTVTKGDIVITGNAGVFVSLRGDWVLDGSIRVQTNVDSFLSIIGNEASQDIHVVGNTGAGSNVVRTNTAGGTIRCDGNEPVPVAGFNRAARIQGQCDVPDPEF